MAANNRRIAIRSKNLNGNPESFYALYNINTLNAIDEWVYEKVSGTTTSVLSGTSISISSDSNEVAVVTNSCDTNVDIPGTMCGLNGTGTGGTVGTPAAVSRPWWSVQGLLL